MTTRQSQEGCKEGGEGWTCLHSKVSGLLGHGGLYCGRYHLTPLCVARPESHPTHTHAHAVTNMR